jgi:sulfonate transport system substrate-binding protein
MARIAPDERGHLRRIAGHAQPEAQALAIGPSFIGLHFFLFGQPAPLRESARSTHCRHSWGKLPMRDLSKLRRSVIMAAIGILTVLLPGIATHAQAAEGLKELRVGYQKYGTLVLLKASGTLEKRLAPLGISVKWIEFTGGVRLLEGLNVGSVDFGTTGDAPPIVAQAAGTPLVYVGYEPPTPAGEALIVHKDSSIQTPADLKGKKVSVNRGGNVHNLLLRILEKAGLKPSDVELVFLPPADARVAFESKGFDAWVIWDPHLAKAETEDKFRVVADGSYAAVSNTQFYLSTRDLAEQHGDIVDLLLKEIAAIDEQTKANIPEAASALSKEIGLSEQAVTLALKRMGYGVRPIDDAALAEQQRVADIFFANGLIAKAIDVKEAVAARPPATR